MSRLTPRVHSRILSSMNSSRRSIIISFSRMPLGDSCFFKTVLKSFIRSGGSLACISPATVLKCRYFSILWSLHIVLMVSSLDLACTSHSLCSMSVPLQLVQLLTSCSLAFSSIMGFPWCFFKYSKMLSTVGRLMTSDLVGCWTACFRTLTASSLEYSITEQYSAHSFSNSYTVVLEFIPAVKLGSFTSPRSERRFFSVHTPASLRHSSSWSVEAILAFLDAAICSSRSPDSTMRLLSNASLASSLASAVAATYRSSVTLTFSAFSYSCWSVFGLSFMRSWKAALTAANSSAAAAALLSISGLLASADATVAVAACRLASLLRAWASSSCSSLQASASTRKAVRAALAAAASVETLSMYA